MDWFAELGRLNFTRPELLALLGLAVPLVLLHFMRARPRRQVVPDLTVWDELLRQAEGSGRLDRLQELLALLARLVLLVAATMAAAGAYIGPAEADPPGITLAVVIDTSPSMGATDVPGHRNRLDAARSLALDLIESRLDPADRVWLLSTGGLLVGPEESESARLATLHALAVERSGGGHDLAATVRLASSLVAGSSVPRVVLIGDGGAAGDMERATADVPGLLHIAVGASNVNLAILELALTPAVELESGTRLEALVASFATRPLTAELRATVIGAEAPPAISLQLDPGERRRVQLVAPPRAAALTLAIHGSEPDSFGEDDLVHAGLVPRLPWQVIVAADDPEDVRWMAACLGALGDLIDRTAATRTTAQGLAVPPIDDSLPDALLVAGGELPLRAPPASTLLLGATAPELGVRSKGELRSVTVWSAEDLDPLFSGVSLAELLAARALDLDLDPAFEVLARDSSGHPLVASRQLEGGRIVIAVAFRPGQSNLGQLAAFPLLVRNALAGFDDRKRRTVEGVVRTGDAIRSRRAVLAQRPVPVLLATAAGVETGARRLPPAAVVAGELVYEDTGSPGLYAFEIEDEMRYAGVNRPVDPRESDIAVRGGGATLEDVTRGVPRANPRRDLLDFLVTLALAAFLVDAVCFSLGRRRRGV